MATLILGGIGAAVGSAFGGPAGARLGFSIGAAVGGLLDAPKGVDQQTGKLDDLRTTTSAYGTSIPLVWGNMGVGGSIIWSTPLKEHKHSQHQGGKGVGGATSTSYTYTVSLAVLVCAARPGLSVSKIVANDLTIWQAGHSGNTITPRFYDGNEAQLPDALIAASQPDGQAPAFRGLNCFVLENFDLSKFGNAIPNFQIETTQAGVTVSSILTDLSLLTGLIPTDFDYSAGTDAVCGMMIGSRGAVRDSVTPLLASYLTDLIESDGILKAVKRGGAAAMTISLADLGASEGTETTALLTETRMQEVELPWRVDVTYYSAETGKSYEQGSQGAIRIGALQQQANTVDLPLSLHDSEARAVAEQQLHQAWTERSPTQLTLPPRYLALAPADIITLPPGDGLAVYDGIGSQTRRLRITDMSINLPGILSLSCVDDDAALPAMVQPPGSPLPPATATLLTAVNTSFVVWSGTELRDSDQGTPGFYLAATGAAGWPGAQVYYSVNGTDWIAAGAVSGRSVFGAATSALADGAASSSFDTNDSVSVSVNGILGSVSQSEALSGLNTARLGSEIVSFEDAALVTAGSYTLSVLSRALRASVGTGHAAGEPFVLLDPDALLRVTVPAALIGQTVQIKCVSNYQALADVAAQSVTIAVPTPTAAQSGIASLQNQINSLAAPRSGTAISPPPYWQMKYLFNALGRLPAASDFASAPMKPYFADGGDGSLRFETPGLALNAYWQMKLTNTTGADVTVNWLVPAVDNFASAAWNGAALFSSNGTTSPASGTFTIAAGTTGLVELFYANTNNGVYNTGNQGTFWFFMDALLKAGIVFVDAATGQPPPGTVQQTDINGWNASKAEIIAARVRTAKSITAPSLEARLDAMETDIAVGDAAALHSASNLSDLANAGTARSNLGLGTAAQANLPPAGSNASAGQVVRGDDTRLGAGSGGSGGGIVSVASLPTASASTTGSLYRLLGASSAAGVLTAQGTEFDSGAVSGYIGANVFDGNASTFFASGSTGYVGLDFGAGNAKQITQIRYMGRAVYESRMVGGVFQGSNASATTGFINLTPVITSPVASNPAYTTVAITDTTPYRWVRYSNAGGYADAAEIEITGITTTPDTLWVTMQSTAGSYAWVKLASG